MFKQKGIEYLKNILKNDIKNTENGSISFLLFGEQPSRQSLIIKMGLLGEYIIKELVKENDDLELMNCGIRLINNKRKDIDLIFFNKNTNTIYYRELKGNIHLDSEKTKITIDKCKEIRDYYIKIYPNINIDYGILNWTIYDDLGKKFIIKKYLKKI